MRYYSVHPGAPGDPPLLVREGFNWLAALFGFLWALSRKLWLDAIVLFVVAAGLSLLSKWEAWGPLVQGPLWLAFFLVVGYTANDRRRRLLERQGRPASAVVAAADEEAALLRVLNERPMDLEA
ncbi:DUF2628 domain-containing protein [Magnetospira sp. QH-2]|uniref:DUF2628 domain-containing protein n=1 Tax=Magnetospira sp. (strain QH-2) TaxID=1288970 RepID=UPI0003E80ADF|nr:DUF2628 domain-containing protein [Magnetospira sp. QH-2]CCQ75640.1 membrane protein of unknown function [Magnetospira sp. QH-2]